MANQPYKKCGTEGLFDAHFSQSQLSKMGNPLEALKKVIHFEMFRPILESKLLNTNKKSKAGARPFDPILMFKILILQRYYGLADKQIEYQIIDRTSFKNFLGLKSGDKVPDQKTVWAFREKLTKAGLIENIFTQFLELLESKGLILNEGQVVDASFTVAPRPHNTAEETEKIKNGEGDTLWNEESEKNKKSHKDIDARWTKKNNETFYGYKNHTKVDQKSKLINTYVVTNAAVHDSQALAPLLTESDKGQALYADAAYVGEKQEETIKNNEMENKVCEKGYRNKPIDEKQKAANKAKSKIRSRVEHVFGFMEQSMKGLFVRSIGIVRATGIVGLINLTYNMFRYEQIIRLNILPVK